MIDRRDYGGMPGRPDVRHRQGYAGMFTTAQADGAWRNGTRVAKRGYVSGDKVANGSLGSIVGSVIANGPPRRVFYYVIWDTHPLVVTGISADGVRLLHPGDTSDASLLPNRDHMMP